MSKIDMYSLPASPPCRAVLMLAKELKLDLNIKPIDLLNEEHLKPEFTKVNPQHCIPTIVDNENDLTLWESRAIMQYLVNKYAPGHSLYPKDIKDRANIDRCLYFEASTLYPVQLRALFLPTFYGKPVDPDAVKMFEDKMTILDKTLEGNKYVAGTKEKSIADLSLLASLSVAECLGTDLSKWPNVRKWLKDLKAKLPYEKEINEEGAQILKAFVDSKKVAEQK